jgi:hypothetical protein
MTVTPEYSGHQIACPACQKPITVPAAPGAAPAAAPVSSSSPPASTIGAQLFAPPAAAKVSLAATTNTAHQGAAEAAAAMTTFRGARPKKKTNPWLVAGVTILAIGAVGAAGYVWGPGLYAKVTHKADAPVAQQETNSAPAAPPVELTAAEILQNVINNYKGMTSYKSQAKSVSSLDTSAMNPLAPKTPITSSVSLSLKLARPNLYRIDWDKQTPAGNVLGSVFDAGKGDIILMGNQQALQKTRTDALTRATAASGALSIFIAGLFFNDTNSVGNALQDFVRTNDDSIDGQNCYVLTGNANFQNVQIWANKNNFLVTQAQIVFPGKLDEASLDDAKIRAQLELISGKSPTDSQVRAQKQALRNAAKIKGTITDTYVNIETNKPIELTEFQTSSGSINVNVAEQPRLPRGRMNGRVVGSPTDMARLPGQQPAR